MFMLGPDDPGEPLDAAQARYITRRNWTEFVLSTQGTAPPSESAGAIELVASAIEGALPPLSLPVVVVHDHGERVDATLLIVSPPPGGLHATLRPTN